MEQKYISKAKKPGKALLRTLGYRLWQRRQQLKLSIAEVCKRTGLRFYEVDHIEIGRGNVTPGAWMKLLVFYKRTINFETLMKEE